MTWQKKKQWFLHTSTLTWHNTASTFDISQIFFVITPKSRIIISVSWVLCMTTSYHHNEKNHHNQRGSPSIQQQKNLAPFIYTHLPFNDITLLPPTSPNPLQRIIYSPVKPTFPNKINHARFPKIRHGMFPSPDECGSNAAGSVVLEDFEESLEGASS